MKKSTTALIVMAMIQPLSACGGKSLPTNTETSEDKPTTAYSTENMEDQTTVSPDTEAQSTAAPDTDDQATDAPDTEPQDTQAVSAYDAENAESLRAYIKAQCDSLESDFTAAAESVVEQLGDTYDTYNENKDLVSAFYEQILSDTQNFYAELQTIAVDCYKCIAAQGLDDYAASMEEFDVVLADALVAVYETASDSFFSVSNKWMEIMAYSPDDSEYVSDPNAWNDMIETYAELSTQLDEGSYIAAEELSEKHYDVFDGFAAGETDVDAILNSSDT